MQTLPNPIEAIRCSALTAKIRNGSATKEEIDEVILGHLRMAYAIVDKFRKGFNIRQDDDLIGIAQLAVTQAVNWAPSRMYDNNISQYINRTVSSFCLTAIEGLRVINVPGRTIRHNRQHGMNPGGQLTDLIDKDPKICEENRKELRKIPLLYQESLIKEARELSARFFKVTVRNLIYRLSGITTVWSIDYDLHEETDRNTGEDYQVKTLATQITARPSISVELIEALRRAIHSPMEQKIIELRSAGYSYEEIGPMVGYSFVNVGNIVRRIENRFERLYDEECTRG